MAQTVQEKMTINCDFFVDCGVEWDMRMGNMSLNCGHSGLGNRAEWCRNLFYRRSLFFGAAKIHFQQDVTRERIQLGCRKEGGKVEKCTRLNMAGYFGSAG
jgi:hypothetical protein